MMLRRILLVLLVSSTIPFARVDAQTCVPSAEVCDGADNDCDQVVDNPPFADAPSAAQAGCWNQPGNCCVFSNLNWCPPPGATCGGVGTLPSPCSAGTLSCAGGAWTCAGSVRPQTEVCDGVDNDCNAMIDDGTEAGTTCTSGIGPCQAQGALVCSLTGASCSAVPGVPGLEVCGNGIDDDCNGFTDDGFVLGASCSVGVGACVAVGVTICNGTGTACDATAGTPAASETCGDGVDDDCNGLVDDGCTVDAGILDDAGMTVDAGIIDDAGATFDAGILDDAGAPVDAGVQTDAGTDAGTPDGGASPGCSCRVGGSGSLVDAAATMLGLLGVVLARRMRRARAG